jgi:hypothetical protein
MASSYDPIPGKVRLGAGTAFKAGFFGALGVFVFYLLLTVVLGIVALIVAALGFLPVVGRLFEQ